ncbi:50S ribosomal protein L10 [Patescibacteria group bacterium]
MPLTKEKKQKILEGLKEKIDKQKMMIFVDFKDLKVRELSDLRKKLRKADSLFVVVKKTLLNIAFKEKKLKLEQENLDGQLAVVFGFKDEISPAKIVYEFSQQYQVPKILAGFFENKAMEAEEMIALAKIPSKEELFANLVRALSSPISNFTTVLEGNLKGLIFALKAIKN